MQAIQQQALPEPADVLSKAVLGAAAQLGLTQAQLGAVLGMHRTAISRLRGKPLDPRSKAGELAVLLIRVARGLSAMTDGNQDWIRHFMRSPNRVTGGTPLEQIQTITGLYEVVSYIDAIRGKV